MNPKGRFFLNFTVITLVLLGGLVALNEYRINHYLTLARTAMTSAATVDQQFMDFFQGKLTANALATKLDERKEALDKLKSQIEREWCPGGMMDLSASLKDALGQHSALYGTLATWVRTAPGGEFEATMAIATASSNYAAAARRLGLGEAKCPILSEPVIAGLNTMSGTWSSKRAVQNGLTKFDDYMKQFTTLRITMNDLVGEVKTQSVTDDTMTKIQENISSRESLVSTIRYDSTFPLELSNLRNDLATLVSDSINGCSSLQSYAQQKKDYASGGSSSYSYYYYTPSPPSPSVMNDANRSFGAVTTRSEQLDARAKQLRALSGGDPGEIALDVPRH